MPLVTAAEVMSVLLSHWATKHEKMHRAKQRLNHIFRWVVKATGRTIPREPRSTRL